MQKGEQEYVTCPYNASHRILQKRFQVHLVKCRKNHLDVPKVTCPFNVTHILNEPELNAHVLNCPNRSSYEHFKNVDAAFVTRGEEQEKLEMHPGHSTSWDDNDVPSYNPRAYAQKANVLRSLPGGTPSERKRFREQERLRLQNINKK